MENNLEKKTEESIQVFNNGTNFELAQRIAKALSESNIVPKEYQKNIPNTLIALEMSNRIGASPLMVMQHLNIIYGRPSWSSTFLISAINSCGRFDSLKYRFTGEKNTDSWGCIAYCHDKSTGELLEGAEVTIDMAKKENWYSKSGSKWQSIPQLMLQYRSAAFFSRVYCPEITMGMQTVDEVYDITDKQQKQTIAEVNNNKEYDRIKLFINDCKTIAELDQLDLLDVDAHGLMLDYDLKRGQLK
jgi:uncharacterized protein YbbK (DUF523 family)